MSTYSPGEDVGAVVVEIGTGLTKIGYAGENVPRGLYQSAVGVRTEEQSVTQDMEVDAPAVGELEEVRSFHPSILERRKKLQFGPFVDTDLSLFRPNVQVIRPMEHSLIRADKANWDAVEALWRHGFNNCLFESDSSQRALLTVEPSFCPTENREKMMEMAFEALQCPAYFTAKDSMLAALSMGKTTALVVDIGAGSSSAVAIQDGYVLMSSIKRSKFAGSFLDEALRKIIEEGVGIPAANANLNKKLEIIPRFMVETKVLTNVIPGTESRRAFEVKKSLPGLTDSFYNFFKVQVLRDLKESICRVSDVVFDMDANANIPTLPYELPDGNTLSIGTPRFSVPELLFNSQSDLEGTYGLALLSPEEDFDGYSFLGIHHMISDCIQSLDIDSSREMYGNIVVTGGVTSLPGFVDRLSIELDNVVPVNTKTKLFSAGSNIEKLCGSWIGGSILGSLGSFQQMWISRAEYEENGSRILASRCP